MTSLSPCQREHDPADLGLVHEAHGAAARSQLVEGGGVIGCFFGLTLTLTQCHIEVDDAGLGVQRPLLVDSETGDALRSQLL